MNEMIPPIDLQHTMLLVMDYQPAILANLPDADVLLARIAKVIDAARRSGVQVGYVRVAFTEADYQAVPATNKGFAALAASRPMPDAAPETAVHPAVAPAPGELIVRKKRIGAFSTTDLNAQLRTQQIDTLILAGVSTSGVVLSTVRDAADRDYRLYVLADGCADRDPEVHLLLMQKVFPRQAYVVTTAELCELLGAL